ncbi:substrate-binding domain-containing protein [Oricola cellulosilytica]|uniref:Sulfate transporter n=1 Tax=Oricola cellulosilytica TaxID=1429082 RepID=A0A4R0P4V8_9HYPH|nr:substrate-binding domain-containing protein [Oricola cellulosilytica]TCD11902.1 sulfate transporter [Oricola cellulosilytica]
MKKVISAMLASLGLAWAFHSQAPAADRAILVQSTTSTANSGLYDHILPIFTEATGIAVNVVAVGTGQAIKNAQNCDADVLLVHAKPAEEKFVADGYGVKRFDLMYNDFIVVGPKDDPADISGMSDVGSALKKIAESGSVFASRGDDSGTYKAELGLWKSAAVNPAAASGAWYRETGSGMGATLNAAVGMGAYTLADRATWISFGNKGDFEIMVEGDNQLFNQYGVILVNGDVCPNVKSAEGKKFVDWLRSKDGQTAIAEFTVGGQQLFFPNAGDGAT